MPVVQELLIQTIVPDTLKHLGITRRPESQYLSAKIYSLSRTGFPIHMLRQIVLVSACNEWLTLRN
jgi:hypothetical protein